MDDRGSANPSPQFRKARLLDFWYMSQNMKMDRRGTKPFLTVLRSEPDLHGWAFRPFPSWDEALESYTSNAVEEQLGVQMRTCAGEPFGPDGREKSP
jgi:hypothetical protein